MNQDDISTSVTGAVAQVNGHGWADVNQGHIDSLVESLRPFIEVGPGSTLTLHGYKPPYAAGPSPDGFMEFMVVSPGQADVAFSLEFGGDLIERYGFDDLSRDRLEDVGPGRRSDQPARLCREL